jgi:hypothetical protein
MGKPYPAAPAISLAERWRPILQNCLSEISLLLCSETRNFANYNFVLINRFILLIGHVGNAGLKSRLGR